ncbi:MAG: hypothetical protein ABI867_42160 [Kofleriaceae bacterium]
MSPSWNVASHRPLAALADGLWQVEADLAMLPIGRRMTVARLAGGEVVIYNAIACDDPTMVAIEALGPVRWIVVPSGHHRMDAPAYAARYPDAKVLAPAGSVKRVEKVVRVDGTLDLLPADPQLRWEALDGIPAEVVLVHSDGTRASLIFNDAFMNLPATLPGFKGFVVKLIGSTGGPKVTRTAKFFLIKDRAAYAAHLRRLAELPALARVIVSHGAILEAGAGEALAAAADRLHR